MYSTTGKRGLTEGNISTGQSMVTGGGTVHYDTNLTVGISTDSGVTAQGTHGRFAIFSDTRTRPLVPDTSKFTLSLVRGNITTDNFPLFVPLLRPSSAAFPNPVIENGVSYWETTMQPGLALTWTGPVYAQGGQNGVADAVDGALASWPTYGYLPVYFPATPVSGNGSQALVPQTLNLGAISSNPDCTAAVLVTRLNSAFAALFGGNLYVTVAISGRYLTFTQTLSNTLYLDFSTPSGFQQSSLSPLNTSPASKQGILQTCKLLGFIPGQVLALPSSTTITLPRPFQLAFRTTLNLFSYKNVRWTPEDTSVATPAASEVASGYAGTYFDCYTYQHLLNQCVNPTFQRLIFDEWDGGNTPYIDQCLQRQLYNACYANSRALLQWSEQTSYGAGPTFSVVYKGRAYYPQTANLNTCPVISPGVVSPVWVDCGPSILNSFTAGVSYNIGDVVTYNNGGSTLVYYTCVVAPTSSFQVPTNSYYWGTPATLNASGNFQYLQYNYPTIGTLTPAITYNPSTSLFVLNLDSYGFGGTQPTNVYEGYAGVLDDTLFPSSLLQQSLNSTLNDQARDSWGLTGTTISTPAYTTFRHPGAIYDERFIIEADDYFNQLFGNWPTLRLTYIDPRTSVVTSYVRYGPQASNAGLAVPLPLPLVNPTVSTAGYLPITRVAGNQPFIYTFPQDYASVGLMWNPIDTIVITSGDIPVLDDQILPPCILGDNGVAIGSIETSVYNPSNLSGQNSFLVGNSGGGQSTNAATLKIIGEFIVKSSGSLQTGQEYRNQIVFEPQSVIPMDLQHGVTFNKFSYQAWMRMKSTQLLRPVTLSNGGSLNMRWRFDRKY